MTNPQPGDKVTISGEIDDADLLQAWADAGGEPGEFVGQITGEGVTLIDGAPRLWPIRVDLTPRHTYEAFFARDEFTVNTPDDQQQT